jgi:hypothetical protein
MTIFDCGSAGAMPSWLPLTQYRESADVPVLDGVVVSVPPDAA